MIGRKQIQEELNSRGFAKPLLAIDGIAGKNTMKAVDALLKSQNVKYDNWSDARRLVAAEQAIYKLNKIEVGDVDGLVGEQTRYARTVWDGRLSGDTSAETWRDDEKTPPPSGHNKPPVAQWPLQSAAAMDKFFGAKGTNQVSLVMPFPLRIAWDPEKVVKSYSCNKKVHSPMLRIWNRTLDHYGYEELKRLRLDMYGGCLNVRKMRGGSAWSIHSWGCAYDVDPDRNQLKFTRASASLDDAPYKKFWEFVYDEGAISLGIERNYDWMHFQFARLG